MDADQHKSLGSQFSVRGFPTIKFFGGNKGKPEDYQSGRTASAIVEFAMSQATKTAKARINGGGSRGSGGSSGGSGSGSTGPSKVVTLTEANFDKLVLDSDDLWLVEFYAPWCGHCKNLAPEWEKAAKALDGKVKLGAVDATVEQSLGSKYDVRGYPTIKVFRPGAKSSPAPYEGGRTASDIETFALDVCFFFDLCAS